MSNVLRVLCPVDFSEPSRRALRYAAALSDRFEGKLTVLFVEDALLASAAAHGYDRRAVAKTADKELRAFVTQALGARSARTTDCAASTGAPAREIEKIVKRLGIDLIVMGTHGRGGAKRLFFGSTTRDVVKQASVPVLVVPRTAVREPPARWR